jgi:hypothetical protein
VGHRQVEDGFRRKGDRAPSITIGSVLANGYRNGKSRIHKIGVPGTFRFRVDPNATVLLPLSAACFTHSLRAVERQFFTVHRKVLPKNSPRRKQRPKPPDHWMVAPDRILRLGAINDSQHTKVQVRPQ